MTDWKSFSVVEYKNGVRHTVMETDSLESARAEAVARSDTVRRLVVLHNSPFGDYQAN